MQDSNKALFVVPEEPVETRAKVRAALEDSPEKGARLINDSAFIADFLWEEWGETLKARGAEYEDFFAVARGYSGEARLWVVGERPWDHYVAGLAGRVRRRLGVESVGGFENEEDRENQNNENELATTGVCR